jgi:YVTN family beta-propeller protein
MSRTLLPSVFAAAQQVSAAAAVAVLAVVACAPAARPTNVTPGAADRVYVANEASGVVSVVDVRSGRLELVDLRAMGYGDNPRPHHVVVEPDGSRWYVSLIGANRVLSFDASNRLVGSASFETPGLLALDGAGELWVGRSMSAVNAPSRIGRVERDGMEVEEPEVFIPMPHALAIDPAGRWVFTGSMHENTLVRLDPATDRAEITRLAPDATSAHGLAHYAISPDGRTLVATADQLGRLLVFDVASPPEIRLLREVAVGALPWHPAFTPDGQELWVTNMGSDEVTVVDASSWTVADVIRGEGIAEPHGLIVSPDGSRVYVSSRNTSGEYAGGRAFGPNAGTLVEIDARAHRILNVWETPHYGAGLGMAGGR